MSLGIKWGSFEEEDTFAGMLYLDATTSFTQEYTGQVTKHPIDSSASVVDHYIRQNPIFQITGLISGVDISNIPSNILVDGAGVSTAREQPVSVSFTNQGSNLLQFLPSSISQFLGQSLPTPVFDQNDRTQMDAEVTSRDFLKLLMEPFRYNQKNQTFESHIHLVSLYEFHGSQVSNITDNLVITSVRFREDVESGDALWIDITLEQVQFATLEEESLPKDVADKLKKPVQSKKKKGRVDCTSKDMSKAQEGGDSSAPTAASDKSKDGLNGDGSPKQSVAVELGDGAIDFAKSVFTP